MMKLKAISLITFIAFAGCSGNNFDRTLILKQSTDSLIIPAYQDFSLKADSLSTAIQLFTENPTVQHLEDAKSAWKKAIKSWKHAEVYNFGPVESLFLVSSIDRWPTSETGIEEAIQDYNNSDDYLMRIGSNRKGLPAIEYLLFHATEQQVLDEFQQEKRKVYATLLAQALTQYSTEVLEAWENEYRDEFTQNSGNTSMSGITLLANEMGYLLGMIWREKLGIPFGEQTGGTLRLHLLESQYANVSKDLIYENLKAVQKTFNSGGGQGFDDYLNQLNIKGEDGLLLSEAINAEFENAFSILNNLDGTLREAMQNDKPSVEKLVASVHRLYILVNVDMISQLGILTVYSDNDGD